jgi:hypothetical protein
MDVEQRNPHVVLENQATGDLAIDDAGKNTGHGHQCQEESNGARAGPAAEALPEKFT